VGYIKGKTEPLHRGWFCVKQPDTQSPHPVPPLAVAREQEDMWFKKTSIWRELPRSFHNRLGTKNLVQRLEEILSDLMSDKYATPFIFARVDVIDVLHSVPELGSQIQDLIESANQDLARLGKQPSDDSVGEINSLVDQLVRDIEGGVERKSRDDGNVLYRIEDEAVRLKNQLRATCPEFRAWNNNLKEQPSVTPLPELLLDGDPPPALSVARKVIFLNDVVERKAR